MKVTAFVALAAAFLVSACGSGLPAAPAQTATATATSIPASTHTPTTTPTPTTPPPLPPRPSPNPSPTAVADAPPGVCAEADLIWDPTLHELLLVNCTTFSGGPTMLTVWGWNGTEWHVTTSGDAPARVVGGAALDTRRNALTVYGGYVPGTDPCDTQTWEWNGSAWTAIAADPPPACSHMRMIYDAASDQTLLMGGQDARNVSISQTWSW